jgi:membrane fusion protein (multidrug efflux system)
VPLQYQRFLRLLAITVVAATSSLTVACTKEAGGAATTQGGGGGGGPQGGGGPGGGRGGPGGRGGRGPGNDRPIPVEIVAVQKGTVSRTSTIAGTLEPVRIVGVNAQMGGVLLAIHAEEGTRVRQGTPLAEIDSRELEAQERAAEANLRVAESTWKRSEQLFAGKIITVDQFDRDRAAYESSRATLDGLKTRLGYSKVVAPITGVVTEKRIEAGDVVGNQTRMFTIADVSTLVTRLKVSELEVRSLKAGDAVPVTVDALGGQPVMGRIRRIFPTADSTTRLIPVEVSLSGTSVQGLRPGYTVRATFSLDKRDDAMLVPSRSVSGPIGSRAVFVIADGKIARRAVVVGPDMDGRMEVTKGLTPGDTVIVSSASMLREGAAARIVGPMGDTMPAAAGGRRGGRGGRGSKSDSAGAATGASEKGDSASRKGGRRGAKGDSTGSSKGRRGGE